MTSLTSTSGQNGHAFPMKSASRLTDQAQIPNPFKAKSFGSRSNAWDQVIELPVGGTF